jgi:NAD+ synthase
MWFDDVAECLQESGAEMLVVLNGSPFETDKIDERLNYAVARVTETNLPLIYVNLVGGQDELVFDGASFVLGADRSLRARMPSWKSQITLTNWSRTNDGWVCDEGEVTPSEAILHGSYQAMVLGLRDYVQKNRFKGIVLGMSGGVDSAISAAVAVDAIGPSRVHCIMMPSPYTSQVSLDDAAECSNLLGVQLDEIKIKPAMDAFEQMLAPLFEGHEQDVTEENIQSRTRGNLLMAISNKMGHMVLTTGNKSEMSVGYATLYGDMCGGYSVLKDVYKLDVFKLCNWRNANYPSGVKGPKGCVIPERIITKPPSAELKLDQTDQDSLPPYEILDAILQSLIEDELGVDEIAAQGFNPETVRRIWRMLDFAEYKRRQAPPGVKLTRRAFGRDRRYPITNGFRGHI